VDNGSSWCSVISNGSSVISNGSSWCSSVDNGSSWCGVVSNGSSCCGVVSNGSSWCGVVSNGSNGWGSNNVVLDMDWLRHSVGHINWGRDGNWLGHSHWVGHSVGLGNILVVDWGHFLGLIDGFWDRDVVGPFVDLEFRSDFGDLGGVRDDWATESLDGDTLHQFLGGWGFASWDRGGDIEVDVGVSDSWGCWSDNSWGYSRSDYSSLANCYCWCGCVGYWSGSSEDREGIDVDSYRWRFSEFLGDLTEFSLYGVSRDSNWGHWVSHRENVTYLLQFHT